MRLARLLRPLIKGFEKVRLPIAALEFVGGLLLLLLLAVNRLPPEQRTPLTIIGALLIVQDAYHELQEIFEEEDA